MGKRGTDEGHPNGGWGLWLILKKWNALAPYYYSLSTFSLSHPILCFSSYPPLSSFQNLNKPVLYPQD